jgi:hypothetical protein
MQNINEIDDCKFSSNNAIVEIIDCNKYLENIDNVKHHIPFIFSIHCTDEKNIIIGVHKHNSFKTFTCLQQILQRKSRTIPPNIFLYECCNYINELQKYIFMMIKNYHDCNNHEQSVSSSLTFVDIIFDFNDEFNELEIYDVCNLFIINDDVHIYQSLLCKCNDYHNDFIKCDGHAWDIDTLTQIDKRTELVSSIINKTTHSKYFHIMSGTCNASYIKILIQKSLMMFTHNKIMDKKRNIAYVKKLIDTIFTLCIPMFSITDTIEIMVSYIDYFVMLLNIPNDMKHIKNELINELIIVIIKKCDKSIFDQKNCVKIVLGSYYYDDTHKYICENLLMNTMMRYYICQHIQPYTLMTLYNEILMMENNDNDDEKRYMNILMKTIIKITKIKMSMNDNESVKNYLLKQIYGSIANNFFKLYDNKSIALFNKLYCDNSIALFNEPNDLKTISPNELYKKLMSIIKEYDGNINKNSIEMNNIKNIVKRMKLLSKNKK